MTGSDMNETNERPVLQEGAERGVAEQRNKAAPVRKKNGGVKLLLTLCVVITLASAGLAAALLADRADLELKAEALENARLKSMLARDRLADEVESLKAQLSGAQGPDREDAAPDEVVSLKQLPEEVQAILAGGAENKVVTTSRARLRAAPSLEGEELAVVGAKVPLEVLGVAEDGQWVKTAFVGYVYRDLVQVTAEGAVGGAVPDPKAPQRTLKQPEVPQTGALPAEPLSDGQPSSGND